jgi:hypothetical protein
LYYSDYFSGFDEAIHFYENKPNHIGDLNKCKPISEDDYNKNVKEILSSKNSYYGVLNPINYDNSGSGEYINDMSLQQFLEKVPRYKDLMGDINTEVTSTVSNDTDSNEKELTTDEVDALKTETNKISELTTQEKNVVTQTLSSQKKLKLSDITKVIKSFNNKNKDSVIEKITDYIRNTFPKLASKQAATIDNCETQINNFYNLYIKAFDKYVKNIKNDTNKDLPDTIEEFDSDDEFINNLEYDKESITKCVTVYQKKFNRKIKEKFKQLLNITPKLEKYFEINPTITESINIYNKTEDMSVSLSIRKVLKEHSEINSVEKQIIENKMNFVLESTNNKSAILKEANNLLKKGFDKKIINKVIKKYLI